MPDEPMMRLQPEMSEARVATLQKAEVSPTRFAEYVLANIDLAEWIRRFQGVLSEPTLATPSSAAARTSPTAAAVPRTAPLVVEAAAPVVPWTEDMFDHFTEVITNHRDFAHPIALLVAYAKLGPAPLSKELQGVCGFTDEQTWWKELRAAKARLTIQAKNMGLPPVFPRAQAAESGRVHPIEPSLYPWLVQWYEKNLRTYEDDSGKWGRSVENNA